MKEQQNSGARLWQRAKKIIPGGGQLLSKRSERFLPDIWPAYYSRCRGCEVWDLDGNHYYDFAQMGVGSCTLGYAHPEVNARVQQVIDSGSMCSLNPPEEVELAERLIALHPWAGMARFARSGGEACAIAVRIARAYSGKSKVAFCGYHGWHDWYLAANISSRGNLDQQLLPGLEPRGVPTSLGGTAIPFNYNKIADLERVADEHGRELGAIIMEPQRGAAPSPGFLERVRQIADALGIPLIFDEITSGFRVNVGGIHLTHGVCPDIAVFGKALGNGYPIAAIIGRREVMDAAQTSFISSTFWTERIGPAAALATIEIIEREQTPERLVEYGTMIQDGWRRLAEAHKLEVEVSGIPPLAHLAFKYPLALELQTLYAQEMLDRGYLLGGSVYATAAYDRALIEQFLRDSDQAFAVLAKALSEQCVTERLRGGVIKTGFTRLT